MSAWFLPFVVAVVILIALAMARHLPAAYSAPAIAGLVAWVAYVGVLSQAGLIANPAARPPGLFYLLAPMVMLVMFLARSKLGRTVALAFPLWLLAGAESFRLAVELFLNELWREGRLPAMMTFHGANFDILIGISAPIVAWLLASGRLPDRIALIWNAIGIGLLANVAVRGVLTAPGPLHLLSTEVPNTAIGTFPFTYIPGLMVPLALILHVLSIRALRNRGASTPML